MKISVKVIANSSFSKVIEDEIDLFGNRFLKIKIAQIREGGKANKALIDLITSEKIYKIHKCGYASTKDLINLLTRILGLKGLNLKSKFKVFIYLGRILFSSPWSVIWEKRGILLRNNFCRKIHFRVRKG